jgi:hypothetical protein
VRRHERPARKVVFEVEAVEEVFLRGVRDDEQRAQLEIVRQKLALLVHRPRDVQAELKPWRYPVGELGGAVERMVIDQGAWISRVGQPFDGVVEMLLHRELADLVDLGGVDLDLINGVGRRGPHQGGNERDCRHRQPPASPKFRLRTHVLPRPLPFGIRRRVLL